MRPDFWDAEVGVLSTEPGWYADPTGAHQLRWWAGSQWTEETRPRPPDVATPTGKTVRAGDVWVPWQTVEFSYLPRVCVRHGRPARRMQRARVYSPTPLWVIPLALVSLLLGLLIALLMRTTIVGPWPVCDLCESQRQQYRKALWSCLGAAGLAVVCAIALSPGLLLLELPLLVAVLVFWALSDWNRVASSVVDKKRNAVRVKSPSAGFVAALRGAHPQPMLTGALQRRW